MNPGYHLKRASTNREIDHQVSIAARQDARLRFFRKREAAAFRQLHNYYVWSEGAAGRISVCRSLSIDVKGIVRSIVPQQNRNKRLGIA